MTWVRRTLLVLGWGLILAAGWLKGGDDAAPAVLLAMLIAGAIIAVGALVAGARDARE